MSTSETLQQPTTAEMLMEMPDDGVERDIINGRLVERRSRPGEPPMTRRNPDHSETEINIGHLLRLWSDALPKPRGKVFGGEVGFRLKKDPEVFVGIDVAYVSAEMVARRDRGLKFYDEPPVLADRDPPRRSGACRRSLFAWIPGAGRLIFRGLSQSYRTLVIETAFGVRAEVPEAMTARGDVMFDRQKPRRSNRHVHCGHPTR
jgi:hypothetical protein